jgi:spermidine synthase
MRQLKIDTLPSNQIYYADTVFGPVRVYQNKDYRWLTFSNEPLGSVAIQGVMSKTNPEHVSVPINQSMLLFLLKPVNTMRILNLGLGTAGVERTLAHIAHSTAYLNSLNQFDTVEINPGVIDVAKQFFNLPHNHIIYQQCAEQYLSKCTNRYNVICIDIFSGEHHQACVQSHSFWQSIIHCIEPDSQILINLNPKTGHDLQTVLGLLRQYFNYIALIEFNEYKNIVLILSHISVHHITVEAIKASDVMHCIAPTLHKAINTIYHIGP